MPLKLAKLSVITTDFDCQSRLLLGECLMMILHIYIQLALNLMASVQQFVMVHELLT